MNKNTRRRLFGCPTAKTEGLRKQLKGGKGSRSDSKNMLQVVSVNVGEDGKKSSVTSYEPINTGKPSYKREFPRGRKEGV